MTWALCSPRGQEAKTGVENAPPVTAQCPVTAPVLPRPPTAFRKSRGHGSSGVEDARTRREAARAGVTLGQLRGAGRHVLSRQEITAPRLLSSNLIFPISEYTL